MYFTFLVFAAALTLELFGSYISIMGLSKNASIILVGLAITLDFAKIVIATVLYKQWKNLHGFLKYSLIPPLIFLVIFTSAGAYAFLIQEFSKTTTGQEQAQTRIDSLEQERVKLEARKKEIDGQIAKLPPESVVQRRRLTELFSKEIQHINERTIAMDKEIPELKIKNLADTTQGGTIGSIAKAYGVSAESITKILVFPLVLVIDPLAIILLTVANFLVEQRKKDAKKALNEQLEIEALMASEANKKPATVITQAVPQAFTPPPVEPKIVIPPEQPSPEEIKSDFVEPFVEEKKVEKIIQAPTPTKPLTVALKNNSWMMPFSSPISTWKKNEALIAPTPQIIPVAAPLDELMAELSSMQPPVEIEQKITNPETIRENIIFTEPKKNEELNKLQTKKDLEEGENISIKNYEDNSQIISTAYEETSTSLDSDNLYDTAPEYEILEQNTTLPEDAVNESISVDDILVEDFASEEEVKMALAWGQDDGFQEASDPSDIISETLEAEEDMFAHIDEAIRKENETIKTVELPPQTITTHASDITEQINDDIFDNYEVSELEIMQIIGKNESEKGFDTVKALNSLDKDLF